MADAWMMLASDIMIEDNQDSGALSRGTISGGGDNAACTQMGLGMLQGTSNWFNEAGKVDP